MMDAKRSLALFWLLALTQGRRLNDEHTKRNSSSDSVPSAYTEHSEEDLSPRSYGFVDSEINNPVYDYGEPENLESFNEPEHVDSFEGLSEPEKLDEIEKENNADFENMKKIKGVSVISLRPKERNKSLDPITDQQGAPPRIIRPLRDVSILVRNRQHHPVLIARRVPTYWIHRHHNYRPRYPKHPARPLLPHKPHKPAHKPHKPHHKKPKHKPCKPCDPKVHKKHHKPKKPKKKPKKGHCHHPKKPHHKKLIYYAPIPTAMNYYYGSSVPMKVSEPNDGYAVEESPEHEDVEEETQRPFSEDIEEDVEEQHRLADMAAENFEETPEESKIKPVEKLPSSNSSILF